MARSIDATSSTPRKAARSGQSDARSATTRPGSPQDVEWEISESEPESSESSKSSEESTSASSSSSSSSSDRSQQPPAMRQPRVVAPQAHSSLATERPSGEARAESHRHKKRTYRREEDEAARRTTYTSRPVSQDMEEVTSRSFSSRQYSPAASYNRYREASEAHRSPDHSGRLSTDQRPRRRHHSSREGSSRGHMDRGSDLKRPATASKVSHAGGKATRPGLQRSNTASNQRSSWFPPIPDRRISSSTVVPRAPLNRSNTEPRVIPTVGTTRIQSPQAIRKPLAREGSVAGSERRSVSSGILSGLFGRPPPRGPVKRVECTTCLSDDVPITRSAKLGCGHVMCHDCLKRIFTLSVNDPQHMPPKCCTADHIPLKHVDRLFSDKFKMTWNRKYQEYTTKNRIYCPARGCGEWIKPGNIYTEGGRKCGKCQRCRTKVCCVCNGKWHVKRDCPRDEETNRLVETAKAEGWQRCFNCRAMVELKEGCNHMTCRCRAEFCMICGSKWKTCNCPWFNYDQVVTDRLNHMNIPGNPENPDVARLRHRPTIAGRRPVGYEEELAQRRRQEEEDEALARRLQTLGFDNDDMINRFGGVQGTGNAYGQLMNAEFIQRARDLISGPYTPAQAAADNLNATNRRRSTRAGSNVSAAADPAATPPLRIHSTASRLYNRDQRTRASERIVPRRTNTTYEQEAQLHTPRSKIETSPQRTSELAGVTRPRRQGRVDAWLDHVEDGL